MSITQIQLHMNNLIEEKSNSDLNQPNNQLDVYFQPTNYVP